MNPSLVFSDTFAAMGTRCDVVITGLETSFCEKVFQIIKAEVSVLEKQLSRFIPESPISLLNKTPKNIWVDIEPDLWDVITICHDFYLMSNGAFDVTVAPIIQLWKNKKKPTAAEISQAKTRSGFDKVELDLENRRLQFLADGVEFDLGALGKGIALDVIQPILKKQGVKNAVVSFGESSILALGSHPNGAYWPLGIRNQREAGEFVHVFATTNETVTTSGTLITDDTGRVSERRHIISPETGEVVKSNKTVSVKSESATLGEFISTTWLILPETDKNNLLEKFKGIEILEVNYLENDVETKLSVVGNKNEGEIK